MKSQGNEIWHNRPHCHVQLVLDQIEETAPVVNTLWVPLRQTFRLGICPSIQAQIKEELNEEG